MFDGEHGIALHAVQGNRASSHGEGKSHIFSRVAVGTWCTFPSYGWDGHSKLVFVQRCPDSCLVTREPSGVSKRLGRVIGMLLDVRQCPRVPF